MSNEPHIHPPRRRLRVAQEPVVARAAAMLRAMGDPARLRLLERLTLGGAHCVSELAEISGAGMSTVSERLRPLRVEKLIRSRREGKHVYYEIADDHVAALVTAALEHANED